MTRSGATVVAMGAACAATFAILAYLIRKRREKQPTIERFYPIGTPGQPWGAAERKEWARTRQVMRSYQDEVVQKLEKSLPPSFVLEKYGALSQAPARYPLYAARSREWSPTKPCVLVTGGVHGYETSGVQGAILFLLSAAEEYGELFNIVVAPCVSPWAYETIQRWTNLAVDPNRSFNPHGPRVEGRPFNPEAATEESSALIAHLASLGVREWACHIDCHETTDSDAVEFTPAKLARDGLPPAPDIIPDGFFLVAGDLLDGYPEGARGEELRSWHRAVVDAVRQVTHIAPAEPDGTICGDQVIQEGVVGIPKPSEIGLCAGVTNALLAITTEVYPDSPKVPREMSDDVCNRAQAAAITSALEHIVNARGLRPSRRRGAETDSGMLSPASTVKRLDKSIEEQRQQLEAERERLRARRSSRAAAKS
jgi:hypothetical protein